MGLVLELSISLLGVQAGVVVVPDYAVCNLAPFLVKVLN